MDNYRWFVRPLDRSLTGYGIEWDFLNRRFLASHPMFDSRYVDALLRHFGDGDEHLCRCEWNGDLVGIGILERSRPGVWRSFIPAQSPGFPLGPLLLKDSSSLLELLPALPGWAGQVDFLCRDPLLGPAFPGPDLSCRTMPHVLTMAVRLEGGFDAYWQKRSGNLRGAIRQRLNRLSKAGLVPSLVRLEKPGEMAGAVSRYAALELSGWKGRAGSAVSPDNAKGRFYREIMEGYAETGQAAVYEYWLGERHAASQMIIFNDRMAIYLKTAYDEELADFSPGLLLLRELIQDSFSRLPGGVFEFYTNTNASPLQLAWATEQRWIEHVSIYRSDAVRKLASALQASKGLAARLAALGRGLRPAAPQLPG